MAQRVDWASKKLGLESNPPCHTAINHTARTMPKQTLLQSLITALTHAHQTGQTLPATDWAHAVQSEDAAYAVQDGVAAALGWVSGPQVRHWKSGGAARLGPFSHAPLNPAGVNPRTRPESVLGVEAEVALRLGREVSPEMACAMTPEAAGDWIDAMAVAVEWVGSRWAEGLNAPALLCMADHQSNLGLAHGPWLPYVTRDWSSQVCTLQIGDQAPITRTGSHSLNDPAWLLPAWLQHLTRHGASVAAGTVVTTGAWLGCLPVQPGEQVRVVFEDLGTLELS